MFDTLERGILLNLESIVKGFNNVKCDRLERTAIELVIFVIVCYFFTKHNKYNKVFVE